MRVIHQRDFGLMWLGALISGIGNFVLLAALPYFVYATSGSALATAGTFASEMLPMLLVPTIAGIYADQWRRKPVLVASDCLRGLLLLPLLAVHGVSTFWIIYVTAFLGAAVGNFAGPFGGAAIPHVVEEEDLPAANAAFSVATNLAVLAGYPLGGILLQQVGLDAVVLIDAASFLLSGLLVAGVCRPLQGEQLQAVPDTQHFLRRTFSSWRSGLIVVRSEYWLSVLFMVLSLTFLGNGIIHSVLAPFVRSVLHGSAQFYSWVLTAQGVGGIVAALGIGWLSSRSTPSQLVAWGLLSLGMIDLLIVFLASRSAIVICMVLAGPPALFAVASLNTILQSRIADAYRGRVFGLYLSVNALASLLGSLLAGVLTDAVGSRAVLGGGGILFVLAGILALLALVPRMRQTDSTY